MNDGPSRSLFNDEVAELVAIGAAIGANCELCLRWHHQHARELGVTDEDMARAVSVAQMVKDMPATRMTRLAERLGIAGNVAAETTECAGPGGGGCCGGDGDDDPCSCEETGGDPLCCSDHDADDV